MPKSTAAGLMLACLLTGQPHAAASGGAVGTQCGETIHTLQWRGDTRHFRVFVPPSVCNDPAHTQVPLVVVLHCLGCEPENDFGWNRQANLTGFVVARPLSLSTLKMPSWNAGECCGEALERKLDDVGFVDEVARQMVGSGRVRADALFLSGWSNGGFLTTKAFFTGSTSWAAIAPVAGYSYETIQKVSAGWRGAGAGRAAIPIIINHGAQDNKVKFAGCCSSLPACCCGITQASIATGDHCLSAEHAVSKGWGTFNGCSSNGTNMGFTNREGEQVGSGGAAFALELNPPMPLHTSSPLTAPPFPPTRRPCSPTRTFSATSATAAMRRRWGVPPSTLQCAGPQPFREIVRLTWRRRRRRRQVFCIHNTPSAAEHVGLPGHDPAGHHIFELSVPTIATFFGQVFGRILSQPAAGTAAAGPPQLAADEDAAQEPERVGAAAPPGNSAELAAVVVAAAAPVSKVALEPASSVSAGATGAVLLMHPIATVALVLSAFAVTTLAAQRRAPAR